MPSPTGKARRPFGAGREILIWSAAAFGTYAIGVAAYLGQFPWSKAWGVLGSTAVIGTATLAVGLLLGFLFGLPRTVEDSGAPPATGDARTGDPWPVYRSNTNLEQISDWLTKILVGVGLIQLVRIPEAARSLAHWLTPSLGSVPSSGAFAMGIVVYNLVAGFLIGYLVTRLRMARALSSADAEIRDEKIALQDAIWSLAPEPEGTRGFGVMGAPERRKVVELDSRVRRLEGAGGQLDADTYRLLAEHLERAGRYEDAETTYLKAAEAEPDDPAPLNSAGALRSTHLSDYDGAEALFRKAAVLDPAYTPALYNLARNEQRRGRTAQAMTYLATAIAADPATYAPTARSDELFRDLRTDPLFRRITRSTGDQPGSDS
ncbi:MULTISPECIES: tetratricopeptide repeat protein [unclassified Streptomyces]|uniref:tetratricopeptide repeat protein n=1 Tax=unclassified Streptomyces TaxID=2593676 RepID=UPI0022551E77|nr:MULTISPECIES: tetratricopeptide repeat protein [unclassified Streptomyces]MCX4525585.1 hypothetical protein [Streptomyces sp. NBC_01551]MCX4543943.1 hypothetical protein [Streptomyces sp. NBC_01565]